MAANAAAPSARELYHSEEFAGLSGLCLTDLRRAEDEIRRYGSEEGANMHTLNLYGLKLVTLPGRTLVGLKGLFKLRCGKNALVSLPPELGECTTLQLLDCSMNDSLREIPSEIGRCSDLRVLYCSNSGIESLPNEIGGCPKLSTLYCNGNMIRCLPPSLGDCRQLVYLSCGGNLITFLPPELGKCAKLRELRCSSNYITHLPPELGMCTELRSINALDNPLAGGETTDPDELRRRWSERPHTKAAGRY